MADIALLGRKDFVRHELRTVQLVLFGNVRLVADVAPSAYSAYVGSSALSQVRSGYQWLTMLSSFRRRGEPLRALKTPEIPLGDVNLLEMSFARPLCGVVCAAKNAIVDSYRRGL